MEGLPKTSPNIPLRALYYKQPCLQESVLFLLLPGDPTGEAQGPVMNSLGLG